MTLNKQWNWGSCTKLALSGSWTHGMIAQSVRGLERPNGLIKISLVVEWHCNGMLQIYFIVCQSSNKKVTKRIDHCSELFFYVHIKNSKIWKFQKFENEKKVIWLLTVSKAIDDKMQNAPWFLTVRKSWKHKKKN